MAPECGGFAGMVHLVLDLLCACPPECGTLGYGLPVQPEPGWLQGCSAAQAIKVLTSEKHGVHGRLSNGCQEEAARRIKHRAVKVLQAAACTGIAAGSTRPTIPVSASALS